MIRLNLNIPNTVLIVTLFAGPTISGETENVTKYCDLNPSCSYEINVGKHTEYIVTGYCGKSSADHTMPHEMSCSTKEVWITCNVESDAGKGAWQCQCNVEKQSEKYKLNVGIVCK